jgi:hypothetical protein
LDRLEHDDAYDDLEDDDIDDELDSEASDEGDADDDMDEQDDDEGEIEEAGEDEEEDEEEEDETGSNEGIALSDSLSSRSSKRPLSAPTRAPRSSRAPSRIPNDSRVHAAGDSQMVESDLLDGARHAWERAEDQDSFFSEDEEENDPGDLNETTGTCDRPEGFLGENDFDVAVGVLGEPSQLVNAASMRPSEQQLGIIELSTGGSESDELGDIEEQIDNAPYIVSPSSSSRRSNRPVASSRMQRKLRSSSGTSAGLGVGLDSISGLLSQADEEMSGIL